MKDEREAIPTKEGIMFLPIPTRRQRIRYALAWLTVRPRRWFFSQCVWQGGEVRWLPKRRDDWDLWDEMDGRKPSTFRNIAWPNLHWVLAYRTVFRFFKWLYWDGWRGLCRWKDGRRASFPWYARLVQRIGDTTAGQALHSSECFHCAAPDCDEGELANDDTGTTFILEDTWTSSTMDGTDYCSRGTTICPRCGYRDELEDSSL